MDSPRTDPLTGLPTVELPEHMCRRELRDMDPGHIAIIEDIYCQLIKGSITEVRLHDEYRTVEQAINLLWDFAVPNYVDQLPSRPLSKRMMTFLIEENEVAHARLMVLVDNVNAEYARLQIRKQQEQANVTSSVEGSTDNPAYDAAMQFYEEIGRLLTKQNEVSHLPGENPAHAIGWKDFPALSKVAKARVKPDCLEKKSQNNLNNFLHLAKTDLRDNYPEVYKHFADIARAGRAKREQDSGDWFSAVVSSDAFHALDKYPRRQLVLLDLKARIEQIKAVNPDLLTKGFTHAPSDCRVAVDPEQFRLIMKEDAVERLGWLKVKRRVTKGNLYVINAG